MQTQLHETAKWMSAGFATVSGLGSYSGDQVLAWTGTAIAVLSTLVSWLIAQRASLRQANREQKWTDAVLDWQIDQLKAGRLQLPRPARAETEPPPVPNPLPVPSVPVIVLTPDPDDGNKGTAA